MAITLDGTSGITTPSITSPLQLSNVALAGTAVAGQLEYNGLAPYFTPLGTQRGIIPGQQFYCLQTGVTFATDTATHSIYNVGVTLSSSTIYKFEALFVLVKAGTNVTAISSMGFGGTATVNNILYQTHSVFDSGGIPQVDSTSDLATINTTAQTAFTVSASVGTTTAFISGVVSINAGGTFIPLYSQNASAAGTYTTQPGSYFSIYPIGVAGSNVSIGTWA
jgi:hypothetical protein